MSDVNANIDINIDASQALAELKSLQRQISLFYTSINKGSATAAAAAQNMQRNLINSINATGDFEARIRTISTASESFTTALEKNKLSMGEYFRYAGGASKTFSRLFRSEMETIQKTAIDRVKTLQTQYIKLGRDAQGAMKAIAIRPVALDMENYATKTMIAAQRQQILNQLLKQGSTNLLNFGKNTQWAGRQLMVGFTVPLTYLGTIAGKTFMEMEQAAIKFRRVYGDMLTPAAETEKVLQDLQQLASEFTNYGVAVVDTMEMAAKAAAMGKKGAELTAQVAEATRLAVLGAVEQEQALETTISLTNAFGIAAEDLAQSINFLNAVENQTVVGIEDLTIAIPKAGPVVRQLGGDVKDLAFFLTAMKEGGINASEGANALKSGLASLINPTDKASQFLGKLGININNIVERNKGQLRNTVVEFAMALDKLDPLNRARAIEQLFGKFQFARLSTLFQNVIKDGSQAANVLDLAGKSVEELAILSERELGAIENSTTAKFQSAVEQLKKSLVPLGEQFLKIATPIAEFFTKILEKFNSLEDGTKNTIAKVVAIIGGLGPIALMTFGLLANGIANIVKLGLTLRQGYQRLTGASGDLAKSTQYATQEQLEAASVAASLDQAHARLTQRFTVETQALNNLRDAYQRASTAAQNFAMANPGAMLPPKPGRGPIRRALGGTVPGTGNQDTVPAMLTPGEYVVNKRATQNNLPLLRAINKDGDVQKFALGGMVARIAGRRQPLKQIMSPDQKKELDFLRQRLTEGNWQEAKANLTTSQRKLLRNEMQPTQHTGFMYRGTKLPKDVLAGIRPGSLFAAGGGLQSFSQNESTGRLFASQHTVGLKNVSGGDYRLTPKIQRNWRPPNAPGYSSYGTNVQPRTLRQARKWARKEYVKELGLWEMRSANARKRRGQIQAELSRVLGSRPEDLIPADKKQYLMTQQLNYDIKKQNMRGVDARKITRTQLRKIAPGLPPITLSEYGQNLKKQMIADLSEKLRLEGPLNEQGMLKGSQSLVELHKKNVMFYDKFTPALLKVLVRGGTKGINLGAGRELANKTVGGPSVFRHENEMLFNSPFYRALSAPIMKGQIAEITAEMVGVKRFAKGGMVSSSKSRKMLANGLAKGYLIGGDVTGNSQTAVYVGDSVFYTKTPRSAQTLQTMIDALISEGVRTPDRIIQSLTSMATRGTKMTSSKLASQLSLKKASTSSQSIKKIMKDIESKNPYFADEAKYIIKKYGDKLTPKQLENALMLNASHINPAYAKDASGKKVFDLINLFGDRGLINNYMNGISIGGGSGGNKLLEYLVKNATTAELTKFMNLATNDVGTEQFRKRLSLLYQGFHPTDFRQAQALATFIEWSGSKEAKSYAALKGISYRPPSLNAQIVADVLRRRSSHQFYSKNAPFLSRYSGKTSQQLRGEMRGVRTLSKEAQTIREIVRLKEREYQVRERFKKLGMPLNAAFGLAEDAALKTKNIVGRRFIRRNSGGSIPGTGNTDTVPALLTPGEFVINKNATKNNRALLEQINANGKTQKFNKGGMAQIQRFQGGGDVKDSRWTIFSGKSGAEALGGSLDDIKKESGKFKASLSALNGKMPGVSAALMSVGFGASMMGDSMGGMGQTIGQFAMGLSAVTAILPMMANPWGIAIAAVAALGYGIWKFNADIDAAREEGINLAKSMSMTSDKLKQMSMITGKVSASEIQARKEQTFLSGGSAVSRKYGMTFLQSESGKQIVADVKKMLEEGMGSEDIANSITSQLAIAITQGVITKEQAKEIAAALGEELGSYEIPLKISGQLTGIFGKNGEDLTTGGAQVAISISRQSMDNVYRVFELASNALTKPLAGYEEALRQTTEGTGVTTEQKQANIDVAKQALLTGQENNKLASAAIQMALQQLAVNRQLVDSINEQYDKKIATATTQKEINRLEKQRQDALNQINKVNEEQTQSLMDQKASLEKFPNLWEKVAGAQLKTMYTEVQLVLAQGAADELKTAIANAVGADKATLKRIEIEFYSGNLSAESLLLLLQPGGEPLRAQYELAVKQKGVKEANKALQLLGLSGAGAKKSSKILQVMLETPENWKENMAALKTITEFKSRYGITIDVSTKSLDRVSRTVKDLEDSQENLNRNQVKTLINDKAISQDTKEALQLINDNWKDFAGGDKSITKKVILDVVTTGAKDGLGILSYFLSVKGSDFQAKFLSKFAKTTAGQEQGIKALVDKAKTWFFKLIGGGGDTGTGGTGDTGDKTGGAGKTGTFINDLLAQLKLLRNASINAAGGMKELLRVLGKGKDIKIFSGISQQLTAKGFTQEFIDTISSLDAKTRRQFIKIKDGVVTITKEGKALNKVFGEISLGQAVADAKRIVQDTQNRTVALRKLTAAGLDAKSAYDLIENASIAAEIANKKFTDKEIKKLVKALKDAKKALQDYQLQSQEGIIESAQSGIGVANEAFDLYNQMAQFLSPEQLSTVSLPGVDEANRQILLDMQKSYDEIDSLTDSINANNLKSLEIQQQISVIQGQINAKQQKLTELQRQVEIKFDRPIEALQEQIQNLQRDIELQFSRPIEDLQETINDMERAIELKFDRPIQALQQESTRLSNDLALIDKATENINEKYDKQEEALNKIAEINNEIIAQEKTRISLADALTQGDISAAAQAAQDMRAQAAQAAQGQQSGLLTAARQAEIDALRSASGMTREQIEQRLFDINQQVYKLEQARLVEQQKILAIQDQIYNLQEQQEAKQRQIRDLEDQIYKLDQARKPLLDQIKAIQDEIYALENGSLLTLQNQLDQINLQNEYLNYKKTLEEESLRQLNEQLTVAGLTNEQWMEQNALLAAAKLNSQEFLDALKLALEAIRLIVEQWSNLSSLGDVTLTAEQQAASGGGDSGLIAAASGGLIPKYMAKGGMSPIGTDTVPAMLTPGEFVVRKKIVDKLGTPFFEDLNSGRFKGPRFRVPGPSNPRSFDDINIKKEVEKSNTVYNSYSINVNAGNGNPNDIARAVIKQIRDTDNQRIRGNRI